MSGIPEIESYSMPVSSQIFTNVAPWIVDPNRAVLLIHDMQDYFVRRIPLENPREDLLKNTMLIRERCIHSGIPIAYTTQTGNMTNEQRGLLRDFWGSGMKAEEIDKRVVEGLTPRPEDWIFSKWRYSAFYKSNLLSRMREAGRDQLIICGVYAHIGVLMTAVDAFSNDIETFLVADAIADFTQADHLMALKYAAKCCAVVIPTHEVLT